MGGTREEGEGFLLIARSPRSLGVGAEQRVVVLHADQAGTRHAVGAVIVVFAPRVVRPHFVEVSVAVVVEAVCRGLGRLTIRNADERTEPAVQHAWHRRTQLSAAGFCLAVLAESRIVRIPVGALVLSILAKAVHGDGFVRVWIDARITTVRLAGHDAESATDTVPPVAPGTGLVEAVVHDPIKVVVYSIADFVVWVAANSVVTGAVLYVLDHRTPAISAASPFRHGAVLRNVVKAVATGVVPVSTICVFRACHTDWCP